MTRGLDIAIEDRTVRDEIPPEGFPRGLIDRDIGIINEWFGFVLGAEYSPTYLANSIAETAGRLAVLDVGCGTGNSMCTLRDAVIVSSQIHDENITVAGISRYSYAGQSMNESTNEHTRNSAVNAVNYRVGDAANMRGYFADDTFDLTYAYASLEYAASPAKWIKEKLRVTRPNGHILFTASQHQSFFGSELDSYVDMLHVDFGYITQSRIWRSVNETGDRTAVFYYIGIPPVKYIPS